MGYSRCRLLEQIKQENLCSSILNKIIAIYFISAGAKPKKAKSSEPKSNLDVLEKIEVRCAYCF